MKTNPNRDRSTSCPPASPPPLRRPEQTTSLDRPPRRVLRRTPAPPGSRPVPRYREARSTGSGDTSGVGRRLSSDHFVGRTDELRELELAAQSSTGNQPALILLGGDSGVGKTRLVRELERQLAARDVLILRGEAVEQEEGELPYAPVTSALRPLARAGDPVFAELSRGSRAQLVALLPSLDDGAAAPAALEPSAQVRLFEALLDLLGALSERQPV